MATDCARPTDQKAKASEEIILRTGLPHHANAEMAPKILPNLLR